MGRELPFADSPPERQVSGIESGDLEDSSESKAELPPPKQGKSASSAPAEFPEVRNDSAPARRPPRSIAREMALPHPGGAIARPRRLGQRWPRLFRQFPGFAKWNSAGLMSK
jgi:hypothetical protein